MKKVGLHQRITSNLTGLIQKAVRLELPFFQFFVTDRKSGRVFSPNLGDLQRYLSCRRTHFKSMYIHASYFINPADVNRVYHPLMVRELRLAKKLECSHIVVHPGTIQSLESKNDGIDAVARVINYLLKREADIQILLENTAFGGLSIGSDIEDFCRILGKIDRPERIGFCIDTVHAHAAGYDIVSDEGYEAFINLLEKMVGLERIKLIHLNETKQNRQSYTDIHCCLGETGVQLGEVSLKRFIHDNRFVSAEFLLELPDISEENERRMIEMANVWVSRGY